MSCGARSQATLMSFWNRPRLRRRELMYWISPDVAGVDDLLDAANGGGVDERVAHHQRQLLLRRQLHQFLHCSDGRPSASR